MQPDSLLINKNDIAEVRPIGSVDNARLEPYIRDAQYIDLRPLLGEPLYYDFIKGFDLVNGPNYTKYQDLLYGKDYQDSAGNPIRFSGIKPMLCFYTLARFIPENPIHISRYNVVQKTADNTTAVDPQVIRTVVATLKSNAQGYHAPLFSFLNKFQSTYTLWKNNSRIDGNKTAFNFFKL